VVVVLVVGVIAGDVAVRVEYCTHGSSFGALLF